MDHILQSSCYHSLLFYDNVDWFVDEVKKLGSEMSFYYFKNFRKDIILTEEDEEDYINNNISRFCEKKF